MLIAAPSHGRQGLVAVHLILFSVSPLGALAASDQATDERKGRTIVQINCATCHAVGREGDSPMTKAPPFRDLHKRYPVENLQEALGEGIATGHAAMPEFKFEPKQVDETRPQLPNWALNIVEKHGLHGRTDEPLGGVIVLLFDAAEALKEASLIMTRDDAATPAAVEIAMSAIRMVQDALDLTAICPRDAKPGLLQEDKDGSFTRRP